MEKITHENLVEFLTSYNNLNNGYISKIDYLILDSKIEIIFDLSLMKERANSDKKMLKLVFDDIQQCDIKELYPWDYITDLYLDYVIFEDDEYICLANDEKDPMIYIVCEDIFYEEI